MSGVRRVWLLPLGGALAGLAAALAAVYYPRLIRPGPVPELEHLRPGGAGAPIARRVVVIVLDGARREDFQAALRARPAGRKLLTGAAVFAGRAEHPSLSRPMYATLLSGTTPRVSAVPSNAHRGPLAVDNVIAAARRFGLETLVRDDRTGWWWELLGSPGGERVPSVDALLQRLRDGGRVVAYLHVLDADKAAHDHGATSPEYAAALRRGVATILRVAAALDLQRDFLLVTADHGHRDRGGHGGRERAVTAIPLWFAGPHVRPGRYGQARSRDVAPTVAVMAGLPLPAHSEGRPLLEGLSLPPATADAVAQRWLSQRWRLANALLSGLGHPLEPPPSPTEGEPVLPSARTGVRLLEHKVDAAFAQRIGRRRWVRAAIVSPLLLLPLLLWRKRRWSGAALAVAGSAALLYWGLYAAALPFSLSAVRVRDEFYLYVALLTVGTQAAAAGAGWWWARRRTPRLLVDAAAWMVTLSLLEVAAAFVWWGIGDDLPDAAGFVVPGLALARLALVAPLAGVLAALGLKTRGGDGGGRERASAPATAGEGP